MTKKTIRWAVILLSLIICLIIGIKNTTIEPASYQGRLSSEIKTAESVLKNSSSEKQTAAGKKAKKTLQKEIAEAKTVLHAKKSSYSQTREAYLKLKKEVQNFSDNQKTRKATSKPKSQTGENQKTGSAADQKTATASEDTGKTTKAGKNEKNTKTDTAAETDSSPKEKEEAPNVAVKSGNTGDTVQDNNAKEETKKITVSVEIRCDSVSNNQQLTKGGHPELEPYAADPQILQTTVTVAQGTTVYDMTTAVTRDNNIQMDAVYNRTYNTAYIKAINHLYEKSAGERSGWMYKVNGTVPNYGCSSYVLNDGDTVQWYYTAE